MRKFITIIFLSMMITVSAFGGSAPDNYHEPKVNNAGGWDTDGSFTKDTTLVITSKVERSPGGNGGGDNNACYGYGTHGDECSVTLYIARKLSANGGEFCVTQIQAGNKDNKYYTWIDYYNPKDKNSDCIKLCDNGDCGAYTCNETAHDWKKDASDVNTEESSTSFTTSMEVIDFKNEQAREGPATRQAWHYVLGIVETLDHGAWVAPIKIIAQRSQPDGLDFAWMVSEKYDESQKKLLCENGYKPTQTGTCAKTDTCEANLIRCSGFENDYDKTIHEIVKSSDSSSDCYQYKCKQTGYGLASKSDHSCIQCNKSKKWGANGTTDYVCTECPTGQIFDETNGCQSARSISKQTMFENWKKTTINEFKCALGIDKSNTCE